MAVTYTENYNLGKQENHANRFDMKVLTDNADKIDAALAGKIDKETGKGLSANDFTTEEKEKLFGLENYDDTGIKSEAALNRSTLGYQRKNLLKNIAKSQTVSGVTFTINDDGSVTANGMATANAQLVIFDGKPYPETLDKKLHLSGCPDGGSASTYRMVMQNATSGFSTLCVDSGSGSDVIIASNITRIRCLFTVYSGQTVENITLYPMLRYAEITDDSYEPYKPSMEERLAALEAAVLGGGEA